MCLNCCILSAENTDQSISSKIRDKKQTNDMKNSLFRILMSQIIITPLFQLSSLIHHVPKYDS